MITYSISVTDRAKNNTIITTENGIIYDITSPIIYPDDGLDVCPDDDSYICLEINDIYLESKFIFALDESHDGFLNNIPVIASKEINTGIAGDYEIQFSATDKSGNTALFLRKIRVIDSVNREYELISDDLINNDINNNLSLITTNNFSSYPNIYFEKLIDDKKVIRVTFLGQIDVSNSNLVNLVEVIKNKFIKINFGLYDLNLDELSESDLVSFTSNSVLVQFYNLNSLGYSSGTILSDVLDNLNIVDADDNQIDKNTYLLQPKRYIGCGDDIIDCYSLNIVVDNLYKYTINTDNIAPIVTINEIKPIDPDERIVISGDIDDIDSVINIKFLGKIYEIPSSNISNNKWWYLLNDINLPSGEYNIGIRAVDFNLNSSSAFTVLKVKSKSLSNNIVNDNVIVNDSEDKINNQIYSIVSQPASTYKSVQLFVSSTHVIIDNSQKVAAASSKLSTGIQPDVNWLQIFIILVVLFIVELLILIIIKANKK